MAIMFVLWQHGWHLLQLSETYKNGFEFGKQVGRCEITCAICYGGDFIAFDNDGCQCELAAGFILHYSN